MSRPIDRAFAILFVLFVAVIGLFVATASDVGAEQAPTGLEIAADLERFRALDRHLSIGCDVLAQDTTDLELKAHALDFHLEFIESGLKDQATSGLRVAGLNRLVEPYEQIRAARRELSQEGADLKALLAPTGLLHRALRATQFAVRNNIMRFGEERAKLLATANGFSVYANRIALVGGLAAILVFAPVHLMARRAAARPIKALKAATHALGEENWRAVSVECDPSDTIGELVVAFQTMASKLQDSRTERTQTFHRTLASLVGAIEAKDEYTSDHSANVSKLSELLGRALGMPEPDVQELACGGLLHDIGKIGIPDGIINKPGKLTDDEMNVVQQHPVIGDRIVQPLDGAEVLQPPVRSHHESWNGTGYPDGLSGGEIPLPARIIAMADIFEALVSDRPYRRRMSVAKAVDVLRSESGRKLDPALLDAFLSDVVPHLRTTMPELAEQLDWDDGETATSTCGTEVKAASNA